ncbi:MAG: hypothetical protein WA751_00895 [Candidatus Dormiibacterota bacterium]
MMGSPFERWWINLLHQRSSEAMLPKVTVAAAGLEAADVEAATRTHSGEPLPEPDAEATAATVARTKAKDQAIAEAERTRERSAKGEDERPRRRRGHDRGPELKPKPFALSARIA